MQKNFNDFDLQKVLSIAKSPAGQQLLAMLQRCDADTVQQVRTNAQSGNFAAAQDALQTLLKNPEAQQLMKELGGNHGRSGK